MNHPDNMHQGMFSYPGVRRAEIPGFNDLIRLALNLRWSWSHAADTLWQRLDAELWEATQNPWVILQTVSLDRLESLSSDPTFHRQIADLLHAAGHAETSARWFQKTHPKAPLTAVAYFSMEFMLSEALPIYSGGLGNVAGDQMKAANDLGVPVIGVGLLYGLGYFRQEIDAEGAQHALYPVNDPGQLPISPLRYPNGEWLRLEIAMPGSKLWIRTWEAKIGRTKLYLLDTNDPANLPAHRCITSELYGGGPELRLEQELVLGIGGWRLLRALGLNPEVCHLNEGHAAFAILERARCYMEDHKKPFDLALAVTRAGNLFTTHTAVTAGFDRFSPELMEKHLKQYAEDRLAISMNSLLALGRKDADDTREPFNMAYLAVRGSGQVNGVSRLHGDVSRRIFQPLFPRWPEAEVPIGHVTNGIHVSTWDSTGADALWTEACGKGRWRGTMETLERDMHHVSDARLWKLRTDGRTSMIEQMRKRVVRQLAGLGAPPAEIATAQNIFDSHALTLGFARRFATYKRPNLLLKDPDRLVRLLMNPERPVQLILAGKAHPQDGPGQALIKQWNDFIRHSGAGSHVVFLSDYDMLLTQQLVAGVDVWINTPRRPWEASGTSGMKVLVNGGLNLSELDGWWAEAYAPDIGWAIGDGQEHGEDPGWDAAEAEALYTVLEEQVVPEFYTRNGDDKPVRWLARIRESMARLTPEYSANRVIREYTEKHYLPAATGYLDRTAADDRLGAALLQWEEHLQQQWPGVRFDSITVDTHDEQHLFSAQVDLSGLNSDAVIVEIYANGVGSDEPVRVAMIRSQSAAGPSNHNARACFYTACVPSSRPASDYTARIIPHHPAAYVPLEAPQILWEH